VGLVGILITALVGFFFGLGSNQVSDYGKRADDCAEALGKLRAGLSRLPSYIVTIADDHAEPSVRNVGIRDFDEHVASAVQEMDIRCPLHEKGYLHSGDVSMLLDDYQYLARDCITLRMCDVKRARSAGHEAHEIAAVLMKQAVGVSQWGLIRRAKYEFQHLY
jgi:hypothetical protein